LALGAQGSGGDTLAGTEDEGGELARSVESENRRLLRARDAMDRDFALPLDLSQLAAIALVSEAHFIRTFRVAFGETPHRYLQRRRVERAMYLLRTTQRSVTDVCMEVGFTSLGTFSRTFRDIVGEAPSAFRARGALPDVPSCFVKTWVRPVGDRRTGPTPKPSNFGEAALDAPAVP
jgi:transcriptional regulator GlxA family with amidase domain